MIFGGLTGLGLLAATACSGKGQAVAEPLLLFTSLPIYWGEAPDLATALKGDAPEHWARRAIEAKRMLRPVETLDVKSLAGRRDLLMIQPRPLSPTENVALDSWVAEGGHLLLFADPALTAASSFALGDRRRPQDTVLLSPILARWGLRLAFDAGQAAGEHAAPSGEGVAIPVDLPGSLIATAEGRPDATCRIESEGLLAACRVGKGRVIVVADAALFDPVEDPIRVAALASLTERAF